MQGLDNTAADGSAAFHWVERIVDDLEKEGLARQWCTEVKVKLKDAKSYLKTGYRVHCKPETATCPDHCRNFALSAEQNTGLVVSEEFFDSRDARVYKCKDTTTESSVSSDSEINMLNARSPDVLRVSEPF